MVTTAPKPESPAALVDAPPELSAPLKLQLPVEWEVSDAALLHLSSLNDGWMFEYTADGELVIMSPEGFGSSGNGVDVATDIRMWSRAAGGGRVFGAQVGIRLPDASMLVPDVAWMSSERLGDRDVREGLLHDCPELIVEIVSLNSSVPQQREKMADWIQYGARLGWLIDPLREWVEIYRPDREPELRERPDTLDGEDVCPGLTVDLSWVWESGD